MEAIDLMEKYGGSFVKALSTAWYRADANNRQKLEKTFSYFEEYEAKLIKKVE